MRVWALLGAGAALGLGALQACSEPTPPCIEDGGIEGWSGPPSTLSATGLYLDIANQVFDPLAEPFHPTYELWSDGAQKNRWVRFPQCPGHLINSQDMDHWQLPIGTRFWKEFRLGDQRIETRLIARVDAGTAADFIYIAYQWDDAGTEAYAVPAGVQDASGTAHDIPSANQCQSCHGSLPEHVLGFSAIQLSHPGADVTLDSLAAAGRFTVAPAAGGYQVPGDAGTAAALGYLHANCGHCHHDQGVYFNTPFQMRLLVGQTDELATSPYQTAVGVPVERFTRPGIIDRVTPGNPDASCIVARMDQRGADQMPPLGTKMVDDAGVEAIRAWISTIP